VSFRKFKSEIKNNHKLEDEDEEGGRGGMGRIGDHILV
jgi:hypothetical protein